MMNNMPTVVWFLLGFALVALVAVIIGWLTVRGKMKAEVERLRGLTTQHERHLQDARDTNSQFKLQLDAMAEERNVLANTASELKQAKTALESSIGDLENRLAEQDAELTARGSELQRAQQRLGKLQGEFAVMSKARADLEVMLTDSELAGSALRDEVRAANMQIVAYHKALNTAKESHLAEVDALRVAFDLAKKAHVAETTALTTNVSSTSANMAAKDQRIATLESELRKLHPNAESKEVGVVSQDANDDGGQVLSDATAAAPEPVAFAQPALLPPDEPEQAQDVAAAEDAPAPQAIVLADAAPEGDGEQPAPQTAEEKQLAWLIAKRAKFHWQDGVKTRIVTEPMDLTEVVGITQAQRKTLQDEGIGTFWELANTKDDLLKTVFNPDGGDEADIEGIRSRAWVMAEKTDSVGCVWGG